MHLVGRYSDRVGVAQWPLKRRLRRRAVPDRERHEHRRQCRNPTAAIATLSTPRKTIGTTLAAARSGIGIVEALSSQVGTLG